MNPADRNPPNHAKLSNGSYPTLSRNAEKGAMWAAALLGLSIPISTSLDSILAGLIVALLLVGGRFRDRINAVRANPIVLPALAFFGMYLFGLVYSEAAGREAMESLAKASDLLLIPILLYLFREEGIRRLALAGFLTAVVSMLVISYLLWLEVIPPWGIFHITKDDAYTPFHHRITHGSLMAFGAYLFALKARLESRPVVRAIYALLGIAALANVLFIVSGRTGYMVALALGAYYLIAVWRWRGVAAAAIVILALGVAVYQMPASVPHQRLVMLAEEFAGWQPGKPTATSVGYRLEYYRNSLKLIAERPVLGVGTGGFKGAYAALVKDTGMDPTANPHNEYLMVAIQLGLAGLAFLFWLLLTLWRRAADLPGRFERSAARGLVVWILAASLVSSTLIDHTEGFFFVWMSAFCFAGWSAAGGGSARP
jgi:O-antigen ligase